MIYSAAYTILKNCENIFDLLPQALFAICALRMFVSCFVGSACHLVMECKISIQ